VAATNWVSDEGIVRPVSAAAYNSAEAGNLVVSPAAHSENESLPAPTDAETQQFFLPLMANAARDLNSQLVDEPAAALVRDASGAESHLQGNGASAYLYLPLIAR
jgi:hypothetical protein